MSGKVVNLRTFRKQKERAERSAEASANRALHGRTKAEKRIEEGRRDAEERAHRGRRLEPEDPGPEPA